MASFSFSYGVRNLNRYRTKSGHLNVSVDACLEVIL